MGFQVNGNTFIDNTGSAIFNANTSVANNFSVQLTPFASRESTSPMQGTVAGFTAGGNDGSSPPLENNTIDKFPFANELTAVDHGDLTAGRRSLAGQSSDTQGFVSGGYYAPASPTNINIIEKFNFTSNVTASDHGDLSVARRQPAGQSSTTDGFTSGGDTGSDSDVVDKFDFATNTTATDVGNLSVARRLMAGQSSESFGYTSGGFSNPPPVVQNVIDKFPFSSFVTASDVGDLTLGAREITGQSSKSHGYTTGGTGPLSNVIDKFPFSTDTNASDVGDLTQRKESPTGQSSREHGYASGGAIPTKIAMIDRFPFATDTNASDVGSLTVGRSQGAGAQD